MRIFKRIKVYISLGASLVFTLLNFNVIGQNQEVKRNFSGKILATNNGMSLIPTFSLDKPAVIFNFSMGGKKLTFEPDLRISMEGKPWSFLFWCRYKAIKSKKFSLRLGAHPAMNFRTIPVVSSGISKDVIESRRFLGGEIVPSYNLSKKVSIGAYYLYARGFDDSSTNGHFLVLNSGFSSLSLGKDFSLGVYPNVYYLRLDDLEGYYFSSSFRFSKKTSPFSIEAIINQIIKTEIAPDRVFVWNLSLAYSFKKSYKRS